MMLEELNALMPSFMRSEAVVGIFRALVQMLPASTAPAAWWDVEADVALMVGVHRHGYTNFETIRKDPVLQAGFQVRVFISNSCCQRDCNISVISITVCFPRVPVT